MNMVTVGELTRTPGIRIFTSNRDIIPLIGRGGGVIFIDENAEGGLTRVWELWYNNLHEQRLLDVTEEFNFDAWKERKSGPRPQEG
jgi:hypothetical protein